MTDIARDSVVDDVIAGYETLMHTLADSHALADQSLNRVGDVPDVDVHARHDPIVRQPECDELSARGITGTCRARAAVTSGFESDTAEVTTTTSALATASA